MIKNIFCNKCFGKGYTEEYEIKNAPAGIVCSINPTHLKKCDECRGTGIITLELK